MENAGAVVAGLTPLLVDTVDPDAKSRGMILLTMRCIDELFLHIHPRAVYAGGAKRPEIPEWLRTLRDARRKTGAYVATDGWRVVPRGPLLRGPRSEHDSSADSLADRFAALSVVPSALEHQARNIQVVHHVIGAGLVDGVTAGTSIGNERIAFVPLAEQADDLEFKDRMAGDRMLVDCRIRSGLNPATEFVDALVAAGSVDIAIAPEMVMEEEHANQIADRLGATGKTDCRLILAGSGQTREVREGQPWNESQVLNGAGAVLWRQRKLWPAGMKRERALELGLPDPGSGLLHEDTAAGDLMVVADIDTLGRCVVLICQDLLTKSLAESLLRYFQPDWVFVPVLDAGIEAGRWAHQGAFELSDASPARFIVSCSTALARRKGVAGIACGMAVGPKHRYDGAKSRAFVLKAVPPAGGPRVVVLEWSSEDWQQTKLTTTP